MNLKRRFKVIFIFLAVVGPGIITSNVDNDAGGITTYSMAGAHFGLSLLWSLIPITFALIIIQEMSARMGVVTGKGLADLIRERFGVRITFYLMVGLVLTNFGNVMAEFAGIASALEIFSISKFISVPLGAAFVWLLVVKGTYRSVEKIFLFACLFYVTYLVTGFIVKPQWGTILHATAKPHFNFGSSYVAMLVGVIGTTIAPWMQFYLQSSVVEKNIKIRNLKHSQADVLAGSFIVNIVAFFIIVVCASTLFPAGIRIETAADAALSLKPLAGKYCTYLFAFGLLNASLFAASILPLSTAYTVCEGMGWEEGVNKKFSEAPQFYGLYSFLIFLGGGIILLPGIPLIGIMYVSQIINGLLLPFILIFMLILVNDRKLMGKHKNGRILNLISFLTIVILILLSVFLIITTIFG
jgi:Mn2+/Fe2+ NRAMP family transporter